MSNKAAGLFGLIIFLTVFIMILFVYNHFANTTTEDGSVNEKSIDRTLQRQNVDSSLQDSVKK